MFGLKKNFRNAKGGSRAPRAIPGVGRRQQNQLAVLDVLDVLWKIARGAADPPAICYEPYRVLLVPRPELGSEVSPQGYSQMKCSSRSWVIRALASSARGPSRAAIFW